MSPRAINTNYDNTRNNFAIKANEVQNHCPINQSIDKNYSDSKLRFI